MFFQFISFPYFSLKDVISVYKQILSQPFSCKYVCPKIFFFFHKDLGGATGGRALGAHAPSFLPHFGWGHGSKSGATHLTPWLRQCIILSFLLKIPVPPFKIPSFAPARTSTRSTRINLEWVKIITSPQTAVRCGYRVGALRKRPTLS